MGILDLPGVFEQLFIVFSSSPSHLLCAIVAEGPQECDQPRFLTIETPTNDDQDITLLLNRRSSPVLKKQEVVEKWLNLRTCNREYQGLYL